MQALPHFRYLLDGLPASGERKPLLLFLHGKGERGEDPERIRAHGPPQLYPAHGLDRFIVLSPQCPDEQIWRADQLAEFLDAFLARHPADLTRIYLTGLSLGGAGAWELLSLDPKRFAAAVLICGRVLEHTALTRVARAKRPIWIVHSAADAVVPVSCSDDLFDALRDEGAPVTYTRYQGRNHIESWQDFYGQGFVFDWLLRQRAG
ncbi:MAG TPA: alpha/beta fold hydrolase [Polyangiales bacterium]